MAAAHDEMENKQTVNIEECFIAAREVATQAGKVKTINILFCYCMPIRGAQNNLVLLNKAADTRPTNVIIIIIIFVY